MEISGPIVSEEAGAPADKGFKGQVNSVGEKMSDVLPRVIAVRPASEPGDLYLMAGAVYDLARLAGVSEEETPAIVARRFLSAFKNGRLRSKPRLFYARAYYEFDTKSR